MKRKPIPTILRDLPGSKKKPKGTSTHTSTETDAPSCTREDEPADTTEGITLSEPETTSKPAAISKPDPSDDAEGGSERNYSLLAAHLLMSRLQQESRGTHKGYKPSRKGYKYNVSLRDAVKEVSLRRYYSTAMDRIFRVGLTRAASSVAEGVARKLAEDDAFDFSAAWSYSSKKNRFIVACCSTKYKLEDILPEDQTKAMPGSTAFQYTIPNVSIPIVSRDGEVSELNGTVSYHNEDALRAASPIMRVFPLWHAPQPLHFFEEYTTFVVREELQQPLYGFSP
jgi:hypothetical protein